METTVADKRTTILATTLDLIAENGFHGTPMSQVAKRSGVSAGIIYHYFESKDDLIEALYRDIKARWSAAIMAGTPEALPYPEHLQQIWLNAYRFYVAHPQETVFLEQYENSPYPHDWSNVAQDDNMARLFALIQSDIDAGYIRALPLPVLHELTLGVAIGLAKHQINGVLDLDEAALEQTADACRRAIERETYD
ncbi:MAG: TetR/AcrR family transcriptional regulator [Chloroflexota bacterium]